MGSEELEFRGGEQIADAVTVRTAAEGRMGAEARRDAVNVLVSAALSFPPIPHSSRGGFLAVSLRCLASLRCILLALPPPLLLFIVPNFPSFSFAMAA